MAESKKRWMVTYTKNTKQKRKVYHDGFLHLNFSTNKLMLFDECENLLECRILNDEEHVGAGDTLSFNSFLVDVGDPEISGDNKPVVSADTKITADKTPKIIHRRKFKSPSISSSDRKNDGEKNISLSRKIIREFKKTEMQRYGMQQSSPCTIKQTVKEWQVLYTTQVTQKVKKYHDGFLQLAACGSFRRQVNLYDASRKLLTSRFLKADELMRPGESMSFDGFLVEIGEPKSDRTPLMDSNFQRNNGNIVGETKTRGELQNCFQENTLEQKEWQVTYTTQMTQKAKKYHDGLLKLQNCGSQQRQIMLYDSSRNLLNSRYLKKDEIIRSGESIAFDAHLVDIGEPGKESQIMVNLDIQGNYLNVAQEAGIRHGQENCLEGKKSVAQDWHALYTNQITQNAKKYHTGILRLASSGSYQRQVTLLNEDKTILSSKFLGSSEEVTKGCMLTLTTYLVEVGDPCTYTLGNPQNSACVRNSGSSNLRSLGKPENKACLREDADRSTFVGDRTKLSKIDPAKKLRDACQILSILQKPVAQESVSMHHTDKRISVCSANGLQDPCADDNQLSIASMTNHGQSENVDIGRSSMAVDIDKSSDLNSSKGISTFSDHQLSGVTEAGSDQYHLNNADAHTNWSDEAFTSNKKSASACIPHHLGDKLKSLEQHNSAREMNKLPTFDLGF